MWEHAWMEYSVMVMQVLFSNELFFWIKCEKQTVCFKTTNYHWHYMQCKALSLGRGFYSNRFFNDRWKLLKHFGLKTMSYTGMSGCVTLAYRQVRFSFDLHVSENISGNLNTRNAANNPFKRCASSKIPRNWVTPPIRWVHFTTTLNDEWKFS